jgi:hypothetical protein
VLNECVGALKARNSTNIAATTMCHHTLMSFSRVTSFTPKAFISACSPRITVNVIIIALGVCGVPHHVFIRMLTKVAPP